MAYGELLLNPQIVVHRTEVVAGELSSAVSSDGFDCPVMVVKHIDKRLDYFERGSFGFEWPCREVATKVIGRC